MELGQQVAAPELVDAWARAAGASDAERETLLGIAEAAVAEMVSWRRAMARGLVPSRLASLIVPSVWSAQ